MGGWIGKARQARLVVARLRGSLDSKVRFPSTRALSYLQRGRIKGEQPVYGNATIDAHMSEFSCQIVTDRPRSAVMRLGAVSSPTIPFFSPFPGKFFHSSSFFLLAATNDSTNSIHCLFKNFRRGSLLSRLIFTNFL